MKGGFVAVFLCLLYVHISVTKADVTLRDTYCYGDSSHANNLVDITCATGVIRILDVITATKPFQLGCPSEDHEYTPAEKELCCTYNASDCMASFTGNTDSYYNCTGRQQCTGIPIVFQRSGCNTTTHPAFTNYLILEYSCVSDGLLNGACTTTPDCTVNNTVCSSGICECSVGYSQNGDTCVEDGIPDGGCLSGGTCTDQNAFCATTTNRCTCRDGYVEDQQQCIQVSSKVQTPGFCFGDNSHDSNLVDVTCTSGVIYVKDILTGAKPSSYNCPANDHSYTPALAEICCTYNASADDCIQRYTGTTDAYFACNGKTHCAGIPVVRQQNNCGGTVEYPRYSNYLIFEYVCVPAGQIHGGCNESAACVVANSECFEEFCRCVDGFSDADFVCWEDGTPGVDCLSDQTCLDPNAVCSLSTNTCICNTGYTVVDGACLKYCTANADCTKSLTECTAAGVCDCITGYSFVYGICKQDEEIGGRCSIGGTCRGTNTVCGANNICICADGYSAVGGTCTPDGSLGGGCLPDSTCIDDHAVCINDVCQCNDVTNYINEAGTCVRDDGYLNGKCSVTLTCRDENAYCDAVTERCACNNNYVEINGVCKLGNTSSVTSCTGSSPYNTLVPDCDQDAFPVEARTYNRSKRTNTGCQQTLDTHNHTYYLACCTEGQDDCLHDEIGLGTCSTVYFEVKEYVCMKNNQLIDANTEAVTNGTDVGITYPDDGDDDETPVTDTDSLSTYNCSIQASCLTDIDVFVLRNTLAKVNGICSCNISLIGDGRTRGVTCDGPDAHHTTSIFSVTSGFVQVQMTYKGRIYGGFTILFRAVDRNAILTATCGRGSKVDGISVLSTCNTIGTGDNVLEVNEDDDAFGTEVGIVPPGYKDGADINWAMEPSIYYCSVQASCLTDINVYVLVNTLEKVNNVCSCNISLLGDGSSTEVTCDHPRPNYNTMIFSVTTGFVRAEIRFHGRIQGHFLLHFRAVEQSTLLTVSCGRHAKLTGIANLSSCRTIGTGSPSVDIGSDDNTDGSPIAEIAYPETVPPIDLGQGIYHCSIQASCLTAIDAYVILNTLYEVNGICPCNVSVIGEGQSTEVTCDGPAANYYVPIFSVSQGFVRVEINYAGRIAGSLVIRFLAGDRNARLTASCGNGAKLLGFSNLPTCSVTGIDGGSLEVDDNDEISGPECTVTSPGYPGTTTPSTGPAMYYCSVQSSCISDIEVFITDNTLRHQNGLCSCNITLEGDETSTNVSCDGPAANSFTPIFTVTSGFIRMKVRYHGNISGTFALSFRAMNEYAKLTTACGSRATGQGISNLSACTAYGKDGSSLEVHRNETRNNTDVSITNPGYSDGGTVPGIVGVSLYQCSVQASCLTKINVFILLNTLQKTNNICSCNVTLTAGSASADVTCDGPAHNRHTPILTSDGFVRAEIAYRGGSTGSFVIEFRAANRDAILSLGCGTKANQTGLTNLGSCQRYVYGGSTIEVDDNNSTTSTEVSVTHPSRQVSGPVNYMCSVQASCDTTVDVFLISNTLREINGVCSGNISLIGSAGATQITCQGPGSNRFTPVFAEPSGFMQVHVHYTNGIYGQFNLTFKGRHSNSRVNVSCGTYAVTVVQTVLANCDQPPGVDSSSGSPLGLIIGLIALALVLLIIAILCWIFRDKIRSKLCPKTKTGSKVDPTPMNIRFPGRAPEDASTPVTQPVSHPPGRQLDRRSTSRSLMDYMYKEQTGQEININEKPDMPILATSKEDTVMRTRFKRRHTLQDDLARNFRLSEQADAEKEEIENKKEKKASRSKKSRLKMARNVISAGKAFQLPTLPTTLGNEPVGTYRPLGDHPAPDLKQRPPGLYHSNTIEPPPLPFSHAPQFSPNVTMTDRTFPGVGLPNFSTPGLERNHPRPSHAQTRLPSLQFQPREAWRRAGMAVNFVSNPNRKIKLDISSVDEPGHVEHRELS